MPSARDFPRAILFPHPRYFTLHTPRPDQSSTVAFRTTKPKTYPSPTTMKFLPNKASKPSVKPLVRPRWSRKSNSSLLHHFSDAATSASLAESTRSSAAHLAIPDLDNLSQESSVFRLSMRPKKNHVRSTGQADFLYQRRVTSAISMSLSLDSHDQVSEGVCRTPKQPELSALEEVPSPPGLIRVTPDAINWESSIPSSLSIPDDF